MKNILGAAIAAFATALTAAMAHAAATPAPAPGLWLVETKMSAGVVRQTLPAERRCLRLDAATRFNEILSAPPPHKERPLTCRQQTLDHSLGASKWRAQCASPRGNLVGSGSSSFDASRYSATQKFKMGMLSMTLTTNATRIGAC